MSVKKKSWIVLSIDAMQTPLALSILTLSGKKSSMFFGELINILIQN